MWAAPSSPLDSPLFSPKHLNSLILIIKIPTAVPPHLRHEISQAFLISKTTERNQGPTTALCWNWLQPPSPGKHVHLSSHSHLFYISVYQSRCTPMQADGNKKRSQRWSYMLAYTWFLPILILSLRVKCLSSLIPYFISAGVIRVGQSSMVPTTRYKCPDKILSVLRIHIHWIRLRTRTQT